MVKKTDLLATSVLIADRCKRLLWRVERAQMPLLKTKLKIKNKVKNYTEGTDHPYISSQV